MNGPNYSQDADRIFKDRKLPDALKIKLQSFKLLDQEYRELRERVLNVIEVKGTDAADELIASDNVWRTLAQLEPECRVAGKSTKPRSKSLRVTPAEESESLVVPERVEPRAFRSMYEEQAQNLDTPQLQEALEKLQQLHGDDVIRPDSSARASLSGAGVGWLEAVLGEFERRGLSLP